MFVTQQPVLRRSWYAVFPVTAIDAGPTPFTLLGENIVVWKTAFDNAHFSFVHHAILEATGAGACVDTRRRQEFHIPSDKPGLLTLLTKHGEVEQHRPCCHPVETSHNAALHTQVVMSLRAAGQTHLSHVAAVVTCGRPRWTAFLIGDPPRKMMTRDLRALTGGKARVSYHAQCHMNVATPPKLERFKQRVVQAMARLAPAA